MMTGGQGCQQPGPNIPNSSWPGKDGPVPIPSINPDKPCHDPGSSEPEYRTEGATYAISASPMMIGTDIRWATQHHFPHARYRRCATDYVLLWVSCQADDASHEAGYSKSDPHRWSAYHLPHLRLNSARHVRWSCSHRLVQKLADRGYASLHRSESGPSGTSWIRD